MRPLVGKDTLALMHNNWHQSENMPFKYALGTMDFSPRVLRRSPGRRSGRPGDGSRVGHTVSVGSLPYYSEDLDLY
jgi:hypothetical protein